MTPLELIDQILGREAFHCTRSQLEFIRNLVVENQDVKAVKAAAQIHKKKVLAALRRNVTAAKKDLEVATKELKDWEAL